ncbi:MAG: esterase, partial [Sphaerospermopsis kisseleviana]
SSKKCQIQSQDPDQWWAWNRILEWIGINEGRRQKAEDRSLLL